MKLWNKGKEISEQIEEFTVGNDAELDLFIAEFDIIGSLAHIKMLQTIDLLTKKELQLLEKELINIHKTVKQGNFIIEKGVEDVHSQVELLLTNKLGDIGKKIHSGRSRNDQVLLDLKLFMRSEIKVLVENTESLFKQLIDLSEEYKSVIIPGYTHLQVAMPSSFGLWFAAYAESLSDDMIMLEAAYRIINQNPLGSAAGYGSSFPLNRKLTTKLLGFENLNYNVIYAQMGRGKAEKSVAFAMASIAGTLSKMAADVCLFMSQNFNFLTFPDDYVTGSSIMPHKKNPDVFELVRAKCNKIQNIPQQISSITTNLTSGYFRDYQLLKEIIIPAYNELNSCINIVQIMFDKVIIKENIANKEIYKYIYSVEEVNKLVLNGTAFRDAYKKVGLDIEENSFEFDTQINHTHEGSIGNLCNKEIKKKMEANLKKFKFAEWQTAINKLLRP